MDFDQIKVSSENLMSYWLFPPVKGNKTDLVNELLAKISCHTIDFIWQQDPFNLQSEGCSQDIETDHLFGCTDYGDNVGDLWFITYLLRQLTTEYKDLVVKVSDSDGDYLLIEAADHLPKWINPETAANRVFIYQGEIHIIPLAKSPSDISPCAAGTPTVSAAVECVRNHSYSTKASDEIQNAINRKLKGYPALARRDIHSTTCYLPVPAAQLLHHNPQLISMATRAFYLRDPIDLKSCQNMKNFSPDNRVMCKVKMTRCIYAQLMQQKFHPAKRSSWNIPPPNSEKHKAYDLGTKIAHGFEILCSGASSSSASTAGQSSQDNKSWLQYQSALIKYNYFQGEIEGSIKYNHLMRQAKLYFESSQELQASNSEGRAVRTKGDNILSQLQDVEIGEKYLREAETSLAPDDDDTWLYMTYDELDNLLEGYMNIGKEDTPGAPNFDPTQISDSMSTFINKQSSIIKGAEVPNSEELKFDSKGFLHAIEKMMNGEDEAPLDSDDSSLDGYESDDSLSDRHQFNTARSNQSSQPQPSTQRQNGSADENKTPEKTVSFDNNTPVPPVRRKKALKEKAAAAEPEIEDFMAMMDRELSKTHIGQSFEKQSKAVPVKKKNAAPKPKTAPTASLAEEESLTDSDDDIDHESAIDMDLNTVKNLLESYSSQMGLPGPTGNLLESMGLHLPQNAD